jgi:putative spermidine/putrescine transport system substrate-binding protein
MSEHKSSTMSMNRRRLLAGLGTAAIASPMVLRSARAQSPGKVVIASDSGLAQKAQIEVFFKPFTKETGIEVEARSVLSLAQKKAMAETGKIEVDIVNHRGMDVTLMAKNKWLEPIDYSLFRKEDRAAIQPGDMTEYGFAVWYWAEVMAYRTDVFGKNVFPADWTQFWDLKKFPGSRCLGDPSYSFSLEFALLADGVAPDKVYPLDIDRALNSFTKIRDSVVAWWGKSAAQPAQLINDKEINLCAVAHTRIKEVIDSGAPVAINWNNGMLYQAFYSVMKGAPNRDNAMKLMAYVARPENQAAHARYLPSGPTNSKAYASLDEKTARSLPSFPENRAKMFVKNDAWWASENASGKTNRETVIDKWEAWKLKA